MHSTIFKTFMLAAATAVLLASCKKDDMSDMGRNDLRINVVPNDFAYENRGTRASESGYTTTFTTGDRIGITVMKTDGSVTTILENNIPYEYDGSSWNPVNTTIAVHRYTEAGIVYQVYYPYSNDMDDMKSPDEIFSAFTPQSNQSSYVDYTASDLMTGTGLLSGGSLNISLVHRLSLVEVNLFAGSSDVTLKVGEDEYTLCNISGATWRCIVKPVKNITLGGQYNLGGILQSWQKIDETLTSGTYARIDVINSFYVGEVKVNYAGGSSETAQYDISIGGIAVSPNKMVESIELPDAGGKTYFIGRSTSGELKLKIHGNGNLLLRPANTDGYIPIGSYAEFQLINTAPDALNGNYKQESDLNLMNILWVPVGSDVKPFAGIYDGDGHTIANLKIDMAAKDNIGLFGVVEGDNPKLLDLHIISGSVKGNANVGGICGANHFSLISNCTNAASINGMEDNIGGIVGINTTGEVVASSNTGAVTGGNCVGGVAGNSNGDVIACNNAGTVQGGNSIGGIVGINDAGSIYSCYNINTVKGNRCVGGVVGLNGGPAAGDDPDYEPSIEDAGGVIACYNIGTITGINSFASVSGFNAGMVISCYWLAGTSAAGVVNSLENPDLPGVDVDVASFTMPQGFIPDADTYSLWEIGNGSDGFWKNYDGNNGLPQLWWEN